MGAHMSDLYRDLSSPSRARDALLRLASKGKLVRLMEHLDRHPTDWRLVETHAGAVLEAVMNRADLNPASTEVPLLFAQINPDRLYTKLQQVVERGQHDWALSIVTTIIRRNPQISYQWWWLLAQIEARAKRSEEEQAALQEMLTRDPDPELKIKVVQRLIEIGAWQDGFTAAQELYEIATWREPMINLLASALSSESRWTADRWAEWDHQWAGLLDETARTQLWAQMLKLASEQVAYDRDALADGIDAMQVCLKTINGSNLEADRDQAQHGHELALKLMRFVGSLEPLELREQPLYMMLLDMLVSWEARWKERGIVLEYSMERDLGTIWVDEQVFALALESLWEQFGSQLKAPTRASLRVFRDAARQTVDIILEPSDPLQCTAPQPLTVMDAAYVDRVMRGHGCQWHYAGERESSLVVSISTAIPQQSLTVMRDEQDQEWISGWQLRGVDGIATLPQQEYMVQEPFRFGVHLAQGLKYTLITDWAEQIRVIVHDLKNLFTFLQQWITQALSDPYSWAMAMDRIAEIKARMEETLGGIRQLAVLSGPPAYEPVAVVELVRRVVSNSRAFLEAHAVTCSIDQRTGRGEIWADPEKLASAITNLLKNGVEAMPEGGQMTITIDQNDQSSVRVCVADAGVGIEAEEIPALFAVGRSTKPGGSGVGLNAVARMLMSMGAEISVDSAPGIGSRFTIVFPQTTTPKQPLMPLPNGQQARVTQQALRAGSALFASGNYQMTVHLWSQALVGQIEPLLRRALPPVLACRLLVPLTSNAKRGWQQLNDQHRARLQTSLGCRIKQLVKKSDTVIQALISGDWDRLTHPMHWAILLLMFTDDAVYPWPLDLCRRMAHWLVRADSIDETVTPGLVSELGADLAAYLELALQSH